MRTRQRQSASIAELEQESGRVGERKGRVGERARDRGSQSWRRWYGGSGGREEGRGRGSEGRHRTRALPPSPLNPLLFKPLKPSLFNTLPLPLLLPSLCAF
eukprot:25858-Rhodomonas_salina.1